MMIIAVGSKENKLKVAAHLCYMDTGAGVGVWLVSGRPIRQKFLGHAKYHLESDTGVGIWHRYASVRLGKKFWTRVSG